MNRPDGLTPDQTKHNQPHLLPHLAETIKQWQGSGVLDLGKLRELLEEREAFDQEGSDG